MYPLHIGVGFGVARFDYKSNARASMSETGNKSDSHAFSLYMLLIKMSALSGESQGYD